MFSDKAHFTAIPVFKEILQFIMDAGYNPATKMDAASALKIGLA
jgi:hypothetical protein